jgi:hypothetical protein
MKFFNFTLRLLFSFLSYVTVTFGKFASVSKKLAVSLFLHVIRQISVQNKGGDSEMDLIFKC